MVNVCGGLKRSTGRKMMLHGWTGSVRDHFRVGRQLRRAAGNRIFAEVAICEVLPDGQARVIQAGLAPAVRYLRKTLHRDTRTSFIGQLEENLSRPHVRSVIIVRSAKLATMTRVRARGTRCKNYNLAARGFKCYHAWAASDGHQPEVAWGRADCACPPDVSQIMMAFRDCGVQPESHMFIRRPTGNELKVIWQVDRP